MTPWVVRHRRRDQLRQTAENRKGATAVGEHSAAWDELKRIGPVFYGLPMLNAGGAGVEVRGRTSAQCVLVDPAVLHDDKVVVRPGSVSTKPFNVEHARFD